MGLDVKEEVTRANRTSLEQRYSVTGFDECLEAKEVEDKWSINLKANIKRLLQNQGRVFSVSSFFLQYIPNTISDLSRIEKRNIQIVYKYLNNLEKYTNIVIYQGKQKYKDTFFLLELEEDSDVLNTIKIFLGEGDSKEETIKHIRSLIVNSLDAIHGFSNRYKHYIIYTSNHLDSEEVIYLGYLDKSKGYFVMYNKNIYYYVGRCNSRLAPEIKELSLYHINSLRSYFEFLYARRNKI